MKFRYFLLSLLLGVVLAAIGLGFGTSILKRLIPGEGAVGGGKEQGRPNVVLISMDTTRPDHLGCYGYGRNTSPNIDGLARQGLLFSNAHAQAPWTLPSHMALFTSTLPSHSGVEHSDRVLPTEIPTLAQILQS